MNSCVCVFSSHSFWTSSSLDVPAGVTQEEGHTGFLIHLLSAVCALIFIARRIQPFLSLVDREVEFLCTNDLIVLHPLGVFFNSFFSFFFFLVRKIPFAGIELTSQRVRGLRGTSELPGRQKPHFGGRRLNWVRIPLTSLRSLTEFLTELNISVGDANRVVIAGTFNMSTSYQ